MCPIKLSHAQRRTAVQQWNLLLLSVWLSSCLGRWFGCWDTFGHIHRTSVGVRWHVFAEIQGLVHSEHLRAFIQWGLVMMVRSIAIRPQLSSPDMDGMITQAVPSEKIWYIYIYILSWNLTCWKFFYFFIFFAMLVFGFWGWDSTNLPLGTHGVTCILYICIYIYILYIYIYILYYIYIKLWRLDPDAEAGTWTLGVVDLASSPILCHFFAHDSCSMIQ